MIFSFMKVADLLQHLQLEEIDFLTDDECQNFPFAAAVSWLQRIKPGDRNDPLLLQVLPQRQELQQVAGYSSNPVGETNFCKVPGLLHKYHGKVLLLVSDKCALNCRFCFRRYLRDEKITDWDEVIKYLQNNSSITEVILSGGDPLMLPAEQLGNILQRLNAIPHLKRLRIHTRVPIVLPERLTTAFLQRIFAVNQLNLVIVVHCNHAQELNMEVGRAIQSLRELDATVLNQAVLLHGINDDVNTLVELCTRLFDFKIIPYYLHILDKVKGAAHFAVAEDQARQLHLAIQRRLPGYLVPKLVQEQVNGKVYL